MFDSSYEVYLADTAESRALHHHVRYQVFCVERGFEEARRFSDCKEHDRWDPHSHRFVVQDRESGAAVAAMRVVLPTAGKLPVHHLGAVAERDSLIGGHQRVAEISRICMVRKAPEKGQAMPVQAVPTGSEAAVLWGLMRAIYRYSWDYEIPQMYMLVTRPFARLLKRLGMDCIQVGEAVEHRGLRVPYVVDVGASWERVAARDDQVAEMFARHHLAYLSHAAMQPVCLPLETAAVKSGLQRAAA